MGLAEATTSDSMSLHELFVVQVETYQTNLFICAGRAEQDVATAVESALLALNTRLAMYVVSMQG